MQFFTDSKFQAGTAHSEYERYCRDIWDELPSSLKSIQGGSLPVEMFSEEAYCIHDGRIRSCAEDGTLSLVVSYDQGRELGLLKLDYAEGRISQEVDPQRLTHKIDDPDNDIMSHEITKGQDGYTHRYLFASGEEFEVNFSALDLTLGGGEQDVTLNR